MLLRQVLFLLMCIGAILVIVYTIAAYKYKYRQHNELSDVKERLIIIGYTERQLDHEYGREYEDNDNDDTTRDDVNSI